MTEGEPVLKQYMVVNAPHTFYNLTSPNLKLNWRVPFKTRVKNSSICKCSLQNKSRNYNALIELQVTTEPYSNLK